MQGTPLEMLHGPWLDQAVKVGLLLAVCAAVYVLARYWLVAAIRRIVRSSEITWDDALVGSDVFARLAHFAPAIVAYYGAEMIDGLDPDVALVIERVAVAVMVTVAARSLGAFLTALNSIYAARPENRRHPIKGYLQVVKLLVYLVASVSVVAILLDKSPVILVSGIGAMTAVLLLIFKDTILSLVASVQLTSNDMIHVGDWVEMPRYGADGDVIDVALHTVKIQNWDKTITTVPTHAFISDSFKNWRGMQSSGGRRIKRSIFIDLNTIRFLEPEELKRFERWPLLSSYIRDKIGEIEAWNAGRSGDADRRRLTNVGTLRAYILRYLRAHPKVHEGMTLLVRQLQAGSQGLPIEIYCFSNDTDWAAYEGIQADILDHVLAILPEFGLRAFQDPSGADLEKLSGAHA